MSSTVIASNGALSACVGENGNYYFHDHLRNVIFPTTEEQVKEWCKKTFHDEYVFEQLANFFPDDPDLQMTTLTFDVPVWMMKEFLDRRDRNSYTDNSAFYSLWVNEQERRKKHLEEIASLPDDDDEDED